MFVWESRIYLSGNLEKYIFARDSDSFYSAFSPSRFDPKFSFKKDLTGQWRMEISILHFANLERYLTMVYFVTLLINNLTWNGLEEKVELSIFLRIP